jgi:hypothetical protein
MAVRFSKWGEGIIRRSIAAWGFLIAALLLVGSIEANAAPCQAHQGKAKTECIKQAKRDRMAWPPKPSEVEICRRIGTVQWRKAERVALCETGANWQHYPHGTYIGGMGMYRRTYGIGQAVTGYRWPSEGATKAEQIAVAHIVAQRFGWSAWKCGSA